MSYSVTIRPTSEAVEQYTKNKSKEYIFSTDEELQLLRLEIEIICLRARDVSDKDVRTTLLTLKLYLERWYNLFEDNQRDIVRFDFQKEQCVSFYGNELISPYAFSCKEELFNIYLSSLSKASLIEPSESSGKTREELIIECLNDFEFDCQTTIKRECLNVFHDFIVPDSDDNKELVKLVDTDEYY